MISRYKKLKDMSDSELRRLYGVYTETFKKMIKILRFEKRKARSG